MENDCDTIISEYRQADLNHRLGMFLNYRDLREDFMEIECDQLPGILDKGIPDTRKPASFKGICNRLADAVKSLI